jgi:hypothetical protein
MTLRQFFLFGFVLYAACKNSSHSPATKPAPAEAHHYIPVNGYLLDEIHNADSLPIGFEKLVTVGDKTDSSYVTTAVFDIFSRQFLCKELELPGFEEAYFESTFLDETTNTINFNYEARDSTSSLQRVDVIFNQQKGTNRISSVYMEKVEHAGDTLILKKMLWRTRTSCQVIASKRIAHFPERTKVEKLVWGSEN